MFLILLLSPLAFASNSIASKSIWLQSVQFNTFCDISSPNFYLNARTSCDEAETASVNLDVSFPEGMNEGLTYEIGESIVLWKYEIESYHMDTLTLTILHELEYESDPEIAVFTVNWDQIQISTRENPILLPVNAGSSDCSVESAPGLNTPSAVIYIFAEDCSACPTDSNGRVITSSGSNNDDSDNSWQITLVITLACAVVLIAVAVPAYFCMYVETEEDKDIELAFSEDVKMRHDYDVGYDTGAHDYEVVNQRDRPHETFHDEDERYSHYSYSQVTIPNSHHSAHSNHSADGLSSHSKHITQPHPTALNPPPQTAGGYIVNTPELSNPRAAPEHITQTQPQPQPPGLFVVNNPAQTRMMQTSPHMVPMHSQPAYVPSVMTQPQPQYIVQQPSPYSVVSQPQLLQQQPMHQPPTIVSQHSSLVNPPPQQVVQHVVMQRPQYVVPNQI